MLRWISIFGGLLIMMGSHDRSEALFYYFRLEDQVPEHHLLRLIDQHVSFELVRQQRKIVNAVRDSLCDETFANLSRSGEIEFLDPELKPSQFVVLHGDVKGMPANEGLLPCYVVY